MLGDEENRIYFFLRIDIRMPQESIIKVRGVSTSGNTKIFLVVSPCAHMIALHVLSILGKFSKNNK